MIPDFLQNLRGVPGPTTRSGGSEPAAPADPATPAPDFTRTLREQQSARSTERSQPATSVAKSSRGSDGAGSRLESDSAPESRTTGNDQAEAQSESSRADPSRQSVSAAKADAGQQVDRAGDDGASSAPTGSSNAQQSATANTDSQGESATQSVIGRQQAAAASESAAASGDADAGNSVAFGESSADELTEVAAEFLVDGFSTQIETTTATNDGLQLEVDENESANEADSSVASDDDSSLSSAVEILVIEPGTDASQPLVLGSLVSIAVAQSSKFRIQQTGAEQGGSTNEPATDRPTVPGGAVIPGQASLDKQAVNDDLPIGSDAASPSTVETPVLPSLVAAKHGRQPIRRLPVPSAEGVAETSRSQATPQTLTVNLPGSGVPVTRELKPDTAAVDSSNGQVVAETSKSVLPVPGIESESATGEPVADHSELAGESSADGNRAVGAEPELTQDQASVEPLGPVSDERRIAGDPVEGADRQTAAKPAAQQSSDFARADVSGNSTTPEVGADESVTSETRALPSDTAVTEHGRSSEVSGPADPQVPRMTEREQPASRQPQQHSDVSGRHVVDAVGSDQSGEQSAQIAAAVSGPVDAKSTQRSRRASSDERRAVQPDVVDVQTPTVGNEFAVESAPASDPLIADATGQRHVPATSVSSSDTAAVSVSASGDATVEQTAVRTGPEGGSISGDPPVVSQGTSVAAVDGRGTSLRGDVADAPVIGGPDRFLSPNVQRALSAIQSAADGGSRLRVQLNPVELGSLLVEIEQTPQGIVARLEVGNAAAHRVLADSLSDLQQALARHQSPVDRIDVVLNEARTETSRQQREQQQQRGQQEQRGQQQQQRGDAESERRRQRDFDQLTDDLDDRGPTVEAA